MMAQDNGAVELFNDDGVDYELLLSKKPSENNGGYMGVVKQGNRFHGKVTLARSAGQTMLPGDGCKTAQEAALRIAKYKAMPFLIPKKNPDRAPKGENKEKKRRYGEDPDEWNDNWPTWVTCPNSLNLYLKGVHPPKGLLLSSKAKTEVRHLRLWAEQTANLPEQEQQEEAEAIGQEHWQLPEGPPPLDPPAPPAPRSAMEQFDPNILAKAAQLAKGPRLCA